MPFIGRNFHSNYLFWGLWEITEREDELWSLLPKTDEDEKLKSIKRSDKRIESLAARVALKTLVELHGYEYIGIQKNDFGKPFLINQDIHISISHSHEWIAVCISTKDPVGIDLEKISEKVRTISPRVMRSDEIKQCKEDINQLTFVWCAKEAMYKRYGLGQVDFRKDIYIKKDNDGWTGQITKGNNLKPIRLIEGQFGDFILAITT